MMAHLVSILNAGTASASLKNLNLACDLSLFNYLSRFNNVLQMEPANSGKGVCTPVAIATK